MCGSEQNVLTNKMYCGKKKDVKVHWSLFICHVVISRDCEMQTLHGGWVHGGVDVLKNVPCIIEIFPGSASAWFVTLWSTTKPLNK